MNTSAIAIRIADFLSKYPPFSYLQEEALVSLAGKSRVRFYEEGELVFDQGKQRSQWIYVVQQGRIRVGQKQENADILIDYRGPGDLLGLQGLQGDNPYLHFAVTETEVMLYLLPRAALVELLSNNAEASRYLASCFSLNPYYHLFQNSSFTTSEKTHWLDTDGFTLKELWQPPYAVPIKTTLIKAARQLTQKQVELLLVTNDKKEPIGYIDDAVLRRAFIRGQLNAEATVSTVMDPIPVCSSSHATVGDLLLKMLQTGSHFVCITEGGTEESKALGIVTGQVLTLSHGELPHSIGLGISRAHTVDELKLLRTQMDEFMSGYLESRIHFPWLLDVVATLNRCLVSRCIELSWDQMRHDGCLKSPNVPWCFLLFGSGGRNELTVRSDQDSGILYEVPSENDAASTKEWFLELGRRVTGLLQECGLNASSDGMTAANPRWCLSLPEWQRVLRLSIQNPMDCDTHQLRLLFDLQPVYGTARLGASLTHSLLQNLEQNPHFLRMMAQAALHSMPPRTIFKDTVIGSKNEAKINSLDIVQQAITPLVDIARLFAFAYGITSTTSTGQRLRDIAHRIKHNSSEYYEMFLEASEAFRLVLYFRTIVGVRSRDSGEYIALESLTPEEREQMKSVFRSILQLMEYVALYFQVEAS